MIRGVLDCIHVCFYVLIIIVFCDKCDPIPNLVEFSEFVTDRPALSTRPYHFHKCIKNYFSNAYISLKVHLQKHVTVLYKSIVNSPKYLIIRSYATQEKGKELFSLHVLHIVCVANIYHSNARTKKLKFVNWSSNHHNT